MSDPKPQSTVFIDELLPGDVLLSMARNAEISKVIAWCSDSEYSHAAIVADQGRLFEANGKGARYTDLAERARDTDHYMYVRAVRLKNRGGQPFDTDQRDQVVAKIRSLEGTPYPFGDILTLGMAVAARRKLIEDEWLRTFVYLLMDYLIPRCSDAMSCAELVFRCLSENAVQPKRWLEPEILVPEPKKGPHWDINVPKLIKEFCKGISGDEEARKKFEWLCKYFCEGVNAAPVTAEQYEQRFQEFRRAFGLDPAPDAATVDAGFPIPNPNPRLIQPEDFAETPSGTLLGDIKVRGD